MPEDFATKLELVLKALSISRGRLASELAIDKALATRWVTGVVHPSEHNLERLSAWIASYHEGFSMIDWYHDLEHLADKFGVQVPAVFKRNAAAKLAAALHLSGADQLAGEVARRGWAYEGFWRTTRPSGHFQHKFIHDHVMIQAGAEGALEVMMGVLHVRLTGLAQLLENQMFISLASNPPNEIVFCILNVTPRLRADVLDGLTLTRIADSSGSPVAGAILFERIGDLKGDRAANLREFEALCARNAVVEPESIPQAVRDHLCRGMRPTAHAQGGNMLLTMHAAESMARGPAFKLPDAGVVKPAD